MSRYSVRDARRGEAKPILGLYGESGCGKTLGGLYLARGFVGPEGRIVQIETESGRGEAFADLLPGGYKVISMRDDFSPRNYGEAISAAEQFGADALVIDSASHEWEATGGVLSMAAVNEAEGVKGMLVWQRPKLEHQRHFVLRLLSTPIPLVIVCMRARYPMEKKGKDTEWTRSTHLTPYQADNFLFELFAHGWIDQEHRFHGTKYTRDDLRSVLKDNERITIETGRALARWAKGEPANSAPGATSGGGASSGGDTLPGGTGMTPLDDWKSAWRAVLSIEEYDTLNAKMIAPDVWGTFRAAEQKELLQARGAAKQRIGR